MKLPTYLPRQRISNRHREKLFQRVLSALHVVLKWEAFKVAVPCQTYCNKVPAMRMERLAQHLMNAAIQVVGYATWDAVNGAGFELKRLSTVHVNLIQNARLIFVVS